MKTLKIWMVCGLGMALLSGCADEGSCEVGGSGEADYKIRFISSWSASTHPDNFPGNPHFSGLVGASHNQNLSLWTVGQLASAGIESMAETGSKSALSTEINQQIAIGDADKLISCGGIKNSPGELELHLNMHSSYPRLTLVSMLAPSPDWFIGIDGLDMMPAGVWLEKKTIDLYIYDAGTDSGSHYTSADIDTSPKAAISLLNAAPFVVNTVLTPVGQLVIERQ